MEIDYIEKIRKIVVALQAEDLGVYAQKVQEALDFSFTSTELLMKVRANLQEIPFSLTSIKTRESIGDLIGEITEILQR